MIRFRFVQDNMTELPVKRMCELAELPRSSFYAWLTRVPSARELADTALLEQIRDIHLRSRRTYGMPRVHGQLRRRGVRVGRHRIARLMAANGLVGAHSRKRWRRGRPDAGGAPDLLNRDFRVEAPNRRWVADISEFPTGEGKLHLAALRDLFHHGVVGWDTGARQDAALVVSALTMALARTGNPADVVHHSDKGTASTSPKAPTSPDTPAETLTPYSHGPQHPTSQDPRMEDTRRIPRRTPTLCPPMQRCDDP